MFLTEITLKRMLSFTGHPSEDRQNIAWSQTIVQTGLTGGTEKRGRT